MRVFTVRGNANSDGSGKNKAFDQPAGSSVFVRGHRLANILSTRHDVLVADPAQLDLLQALSILSVHLQTGHSILNENFSGLVLQGRSHQLNAFRALELSEGFHGVAGAHFTAAHLTARRTNLSEELISFVVLNADLLHGLLEVADDLFVELVRFVSGTSPFFTVEIFLELFGLSA